ncbi:hypothetical protein KIN20_013319 [Parelaphostrongylus tenuis]|uniref:Uncharacterized protein n=1 Tax=Parelaphostrongylus tenuis TaxID=148309 RepID=A0AAD5MFD5_PARTN|nr:hypothetical protein KIN20_013319 [Parelaphostrongylus tenuis]
MEQQAREAAEKRCMELEQNDLARDGKSSDECSLESSALLSPAEEAVTEVKEQSQLSKEAEAPGEKQKNEVCCCPATCVLQAQVNRILDQGTVWSKLSLNSYSSP